MRTSKRVLAVGVVLVSAAAIAVLAPFGSSSKASALPLPHATVSDFQFISSSATPPTEAQCESVGRTCFTPQAIQSAYNVAPLHAAGLTGKGITIAIVIPLPVRPAACSGATL